MIKFIKYCIREYCSHRLKNPNTFEKGYEDPFQVFSEIELLVLLSNIIYHGFYYTTIILDVIFWKNIPIFKCDSHHHKTGKENSIESQIQIFIHLLVGKIVVKTPLNYSQCQ